MTGNVTYYVSTALFCKNMIFERNSVFELHQLACKSKDSYERVRENCVKSVETL